MALRFNPPPNWPAPPEGFEPPAGWQPDPAWGPAPEGWQIWVDDSAPSSGSASSAPSTASGSDPAWAPTQAVSTAPTAQMGTSAPVADPTGMSASAPSGDYAGQVTGASPYAANMDYAQSPTPFQNQGAPGGPQPPAGGWQPGGAGGPGGPGGGSKPITQQWWFWTGAAVLVVVLAISGIVWAMSGSVSEGDNKADDTSTSQSKDGKSDKKDSGNKKSSGSDKASGDSTGSSSEKGPGTKDNPIDPTSGPVEVKAGKSSSDPNASVEITFKPVEWNVPTETMRNGDRHSYEEPPAGQAYMRVPVEITYHGDGQLTSFDLNFDYSYNGTTSEEKSYILDKGALENQSMPRDGGTASGYLVFIADSSTQNDGNGVFVVSLGYGGKEVYVKAQ